MRVFCTPSIRRRFRLFFLHFGRFWQQRSVSYSYYVFDTDGRKKESNCFHTTDLSIDQRCGKVVRIRGVNKVETVCHWSKYNNFANTFYQFLSVDPKTCQEAQISLESVRCFGTEGRKTFRPWLPVNPLCLERYPSLPEKRGSTTNSNSFLPSS